MNLFYISVWKPVVGKMLAIILLLFSCPLCIGIAALLAIKSNGNAFFIQKRIGKGGKIFTLYKFKTLLDSTDANSKLLPDVQRQFPLGRILRHYHLDELPQLLNILKGDMNFIGPRPLLPEYMSYYTREQNKRHLVKPGIAGLSQLRGANKLPWRQRLGYDTYYATHCNLCLDMFIIWGSIKNAFNMGHKPDDASLYSESFIEHVERNGKSESYFN